MSAEKPSTEIENTECVIKKVYVFPVPPRTSSAGYRAAEWTKTAIWSGRLRVVSSNGKCTILLEHVDKDGLFAACPIENKQTVEPVSDSSRYFVLRISDGKGRHAFIGLGFDKREEAFDFKVSLQDFENQSTAEVRAEEYLSSIPTVDLSIPSGGSIRVSLGGKVPKRTDREKSIDKGKIIALAPPPVAGAPKQKDRTKKTKPKTDVDQTVNSGALDLLYVLTGATSTPQVNLFNITPAVQAPVQQVPAAQVPAASNNASGAAPDGWVTF